MWPFKRKSPLEKALRKTRQAMDITHRHKLSHVPSVKELELLQLLARMLEETHHTTAYIVASLRPRKP